MIRTRVIAFDPLGEGEPAGSTYRQDGADLAVVVASQGAIHTVGQRADCGSFNSLVLNKESEEHIAARLRYSGWVGCLCDGNDRHDIRDRDGLAVIVWSIVTLVVHCVSRQCWCKNRLRYSSW